MPQEQWGGDVHLPHWMRRVLHRPEPPGDTPERTHEARKPQEMPTVGDPPPDLVAVDPGRQQLRARHTTVLPPRDPGNAGG